VLEQGAVQRGLTLAALIAEQDAARSEAGEPLASRLRILALRIAAGQAP
jgi:predicted DNA-binding ribbon-helix-helix protein